MKLDGATPSSSLDSVTPPAHRIAASQLRAHHLTEFLQDNPDTPFLALSAAYGVGRKLKGIALVHARQALVVQIVGLEHDRNHQPFHTILEDFLDKVTRETSTKLIAYNADLLAAGLHLDCGVRLKNCINIQSIDKDGHTASFEYTMAMVGEKFGVELTHHGYCSLFDDRAKSHEPLATLVKRGRLALEVGATTGGIPQKAKINMSLLSDEVRCQRYLSRVMAEHIGWPKIIRLLFSQRNYSETPIAWRLSNRLLRSTT